MLIHHQHRSNLMPFFVSCSQSGSNGENIRSELGNREHVNLKDDGSPILMKTHIYHIVVIYILIFVGDTQKSIQWYPMMFGFIPAFLLVPAVPNLPTSHGHRWKRRRSMKWKSMRKLLRLHWQLRSSTLWGDWWWFYPLVNQQKTMENHNFNG